MSRTLTGEHPEMMIGLARASWRALPALGFAGVSALAVWWVACWLFGVGSPFSLVAVGLGTAPLVVLAVDAVHAQFFDLDNSRPANKRRLLVVSIGLGAPAITAAWSVFAAAVATAARSPLLQISSVAASLAFVVFLAIGAVAVPLGLARGDSSIRAVFVAAALAAMRRPLPPIAAVLTATAVGWIGMTWFGGLLVFVLPIFVIVAVAASWSVVPCVGVRLPPPALLVSARSTIGAPQT